MKVASGVAIAVLITAFQPELDKQRDEAIRAFQDSPSLGRFSKAGLAIMNASDWANARDRKEGDLPPAHPEFEKMKARLMANGYRFDSLVETIVSSPQFLNKRNTEITQNKRTESTPKKGE